MALQHVYRLFFLSLGCDSENLQVFQHSAATIPSPLLELYKLAPTELTFVECGFLENVAGCTA
jgi:hypothetical protein